MTREQKVRKAQQLRAKGMLMREVAEKMGVAISTVDTWLNDPDLTKQRARRVRYAGMCEDCGTKTDGSNGYDAPKLCLVCLNRRKHENRVWTKETVLEAIREWAEHYRRQPTASDWNGADPRCDRERFYNGPLVAPPVSTVQREFGSWRAAIEAAGFSPFLRYLGDDPAVVQQAAALYERGMSSEDIARRYGVSGTAVRYWLDIAGVPRRSASEARRAYLERRKAA